MSHIFGNNLTRVTMFFRPYFNMRFTQKVMGIQSHENPNFENFKIVNLGVPRTKWHLDVAPVVNNKEYYKKEGGGFFQVWAVMSLCEFVCVRDSSMHKKCSNYALTNLLFGLCRSMWIIEPLVTFPNPHPEAITRPSTLEMLRVRECIPAPCSVVFTFRFTFESYKEFRGASFFLTI